MESCAKPICKSLPILAGYGTTRINSSNRNLKGRHILHLATHSNRYHPSLSSSSTNQHSVILFFVKKVLTQILVNNPKVLDQKSLPLKEKLCDIPIKFIAKKPLLYLDARKSETLLESSPKQKKPRVRPKVG